MVVAASPGRNPPPPAPNSPAPGSVTASTALSVVVAALVHGLVDITAVAFTDPDPAAVGSASLVPGVLVTLPLAGYAMVLLRRQPDLPITADVAGREGCRRATL